MKILLLVHLVIFIFRSSSAAPCEQNRNELFDDLQRGHLNNRPIIAVLAQKEHKELPPNQSYIAASYVKYLESSGARVVPIPHFYTTKQVTEIFKYVNGVFFPGGGVEFFTSQYYKHAKTLWDLAIKANDDGEYFPVWGTCMGFEVLHVLRMNEDIMSKRISEDKALPLDFRKGARDSRLLKHATDKIYSILGKEKVTFNHHSYGVKTETYTKHKRLRDFFQVISTNIDEFGYEFVSTIEAFDYPIYGVQWHPEKNNFEHYEGYKELPQGYHGVLTSQYMANFFVNEARKNHHAFPSQKMEDKHLIYNYNPVNSAHIYKGSLSHFEQIYLFQDN